MPLPAIRMRDQGLGLAPVGADAWSRDPLCSRRLPKALSASKALLPSSMVQTRSRSFEGLVV